MLSVFPELFNYSQIAPFILRVVLGIILIRMGYKAGLIGLFQILVALFLFAGLFTQITALLALTSCFRVKEKKLLLMISAVAVSLIFLGPGLFSFDLPL